jgi:hypothetical protein
LVFLSALSWWLGWRMAWLSALRAVADQAADVDRRVRELPAAD